MSNIDIKNKFGEKIRVRSSGILIFQNKILLIKHLGLGPNGFYWLPPGGAQENGELLKQTAEREFYEETNLKVRANKLLIFNEFIEPPLHGIEFYFKVELLEKSPINIELGTDPENADNQIITELKWFSKIELNTIKNNCPEFLFELEFDE